MWIGKHCYVCRSCDQHGVGGGGQQGHLASHFGNLCRRAGCGLIANVDFSFELHPLCLFLRAVLPPVRQICQILTEIHQHWVPPKSEDWRMDPRKRGLKICKLPRPHWGSWRAQPGVVIGQALGVSSGLPSLGVTLSFSLQM